MSPHLVTAEVSNEEWACHKKTVLDLYLGEDLSHVKLAERMANDHGFIASPSQFETQLRKWGARKNLKTHEWKPIFERLDRIPQGTKSRVIISGRVVTKERLHRARRHYKRKHSHPALDDMLDSNHGLSNYMEQVHIETQGVNGKWAVLEDPQLPEPIAELASHPTANGSTHYLELEEQPAQFPDPEGYLAFDSSFLGAPIMHFTTPSPNFQFARPISPIRLSNPEILQPSIGPFSGTSTAPDSLIFGKLFASPAEIPISYMSDVPSAWLTGLPSSGIQGCICKSGFMPKSVTRDLTKALYDSRIFSDIFSSGLVDKLQRLTSLLPGWDFQKEYSQGQGLISTGEILQTNFIRVLMFALANGFTGLYDIPMKTLIRVLGESSFATTMLSNLLSASSKHAVKSWGENILKAAIKAQESQTVTRIIAMNIVDLNDYGLNGTEPSPLELAAKLGDFKTMNILLNAGAEINKRCSDPDVPTDEFIGAPLELFLDYLTLREKYVEPECLSFAEKLLDLGAIVQPRMINRIRKPNKLGANLCYKLASSIPSSQHEELLKSAQPVFWLTMGDKQATEILDGMFTDCATRHHCRCIYRLQDYINILLYEASLKGYYHLARSLPYIDSLSNMWGSCFLSAAIRSGNNDLIDMIMAREPNIDPHVIDYFDYILFGVPQTFLEARHTTPLAEAIITGNQFLITAFEREGAFRSLHEGQKFQAAVTAAATIGDINLVTKLLESCEDHEYEYMAGGLLHAIRTNNDILFTLLLEKGSFDGIGSRRTEKTLLYEAIIQRNKNMVYALLKAGALEFRDAYHFISLEKALEWGDKSVIETLLNCFDYPLRFQQNETDCIYEGWELNDGKLKYCCLNPYYSGVRAGVLRNISKNTTTLELVKNSILARGRFLTDLLIVAVYDNDYGTARQLINYGANIFDVSFLDIATKCDLKMLRLLTENINQLKATSENGGKSAILKAVIRGEPSHLGSVRALMNSGILNKLDILDSGNCMKPRMSDRMTPFGEALALGKKYPDISYDISSQLLETGCDPNMIAEWSRGPGNSLTCKTGLLKAIETENKEIVELLIQHGAQINAEIPYGVRQTPLQKASETGSVEIVRFLLEKGVDVNAQPCFSLGGTALQFAAISGNCNVAAELLNKGASLYMAPSKIRGRYPLEGAAEHGRIDMIKFLWRANEETFLLEGVKPGFQEKNYRKAMRLAVKNGHMGCRDLLAELSGLPINAGDTPPKAPPIYIKQWPPVGIPRD
ncbi:hypothetical protein F4810DRAFT_668205 [Camillea tinctor]|nr:hypothetical protein F4810DRAFT_668205 [Camillea tinctor]